MTVTPPRATAPGNRIRLTSGSDPRSARSAGVHTGIARAAGETPFAIPPQGAAGAPGGWRSAIPAPVQAVGALHGGSFAACGRDAALKSGAPDRRRNSQERRCSHRHRPRSGRNSLVERTFRTAWRSAPGRMAPHAPSLPDSPPGPARRARFRKAGGSFAACGRDAALKSGAPDRRRNSQERTHPTLFTPASSAQRAKLPINELKNR